MDPDPQSELHGMELHTQLSMVMAPS